MDDDVDDNGDSATGNDLDDDGDGATDDEVDIAMVRRAMTSTMMATA